MKIQCHKLFSRALCFQENNQIIKKMTSIHQPLTNLQIELLKLYSLNLPEESLLEIKRLIARYFADKAADEMDRLWEEKGWNNDTMDEWLKGA